MIDNIIEDQVTPQLQDQHQGLDQLLLPNGTSDVQLPLNESGKNYNVPTGALDNLLSSTPTWEAQNKQDKFDWDKSNIDRYIDDRHFKTTGFDPFGGTTEVNGKPYDTNELRYGAVQTWGDVMKNAVGGAFHLAVGSFEQSVASWGHTANALFTWGTGKGWEAGKQAMLGSPEELLANNKKQEAIMNKYAIYHTPTGDSQLFSKEFIGDITQQMGFGIGMGAEILAETLITAGIGEAFSLASKTGQVAATAAKGIVAGEEAAVASRTAAEIAPKITTTGQDINNVRIASDISGDRELMTKIWNGTKNFIPGTEVAADVSKAYKAGAVGWDLFKAGIPGVIKTFSMANAAKAESMMEAAGTYGQMYGDLVSQYQRDHDGNMPAGADLEKIKEHSYGAATDNFIVNTGLLMFMNQLEFGSMFSKFGSAKRLIREASEAGEKGVITIANKEGKRIAYNEATGILAGARTTNAIRKDFGLGSALWYGAKHYVGGQAAKFEFLEGVQEVLQNTSDQTFRDYYTNMYNGGVDIHGKSFFSDLTHADWSKGMDSQHMGLDAESRRTMWESNGGWKTFLMGAVTGLFMSPLSSAAMYANKKGYSLINKEYGSKLEENKALREINKNLLNQFFQDPSNFLNEHIANTKVQGYGAKSMADAASIGDKYSYTNAVQDNFTKAVATAIKTNNYDSFIDHINEYADKFKTNEEFEQAFPALKSTGTTLTDRIAFIHRLTKDITDYHNNWENLKDKYSGLVDPELHNDPSDRLNAAIHKKALDNSIELLATTDFHATQAIERAIGIKTKMGALPGIGTSVGNAFDIMGNMHQAQTQIQLLQKEIATYDQLPRDPEIKDMKVAAREQLKHLQAWVQAHEEMGDNETKQKAFNGYVQSKNQELGLTSVPVMDMRVLDDAFTNLGQYMQLNKDHGDYISALNVLSTLSNFKKLHERNVDGIYHFQRMAFREMNKEIDERADVVTGTTVPEETKDTPTPETPEDITPAPFDAEQMKKDIIQHVTEEEHPDAMIYLDQHKDLAEEIKLLQKQKKDMGMTSAMYKQHLNEILDKHFEGVKDKTPDIQAFVDRIVAGKDMTSPEDVQFYENNKETIEAELKKRKDAEKVPEGPKLKKIHSQLTVGPFQLNWREKNQESVEDAAKRLSTILESAGDMRDRLSLVVGIGPNAGESWGTKVNKGEDGVNHNILSQGQKFSMQLLLDGQPIGYLTNAGNYKFNVNGKEVGTQSLNDDPKSPYYIGHFVEIPENKTAKEVLDQFQSDDATASQIQTDIESRLASDGTATIEGEELSRILSVSPRIQMNYTRKGEVGAPVSDIAQYAYRNEQGQMIVVDNRIDKNGERTGMVSGSLDDITPEMQKSLDKVWSHDNTGTYSIALSIAGDIQWIQVTPSDYTKEQLQPQLNTLTTLLQEKEPTSEQIDQIKGIIGGIFIQQPVYTRTVKGKEVIEDKKWDIRLQYVEPSPGKDGHLAVSTNKKGAEIRTLEGRDISTPETLAKAVQTVLRQKNTFPGIEITADNFRHQVPLTGDRSTIETAIMGMKSSVNVPVVTSISLMYGLPQGKSNLVQQVRPTLNETTVNRYLRETAPDRLEDPARQSAEQEAIENVDFDALEATRDIQDDNYDDVPFKVIPQDAPFDEQAVVHIDNFIDTCKRIMPIMSAQNPNGIITIDDLGTLYKNLLDNNITVGQFIMSLDGLRGHIQVYKNSPYKYHEAFHAIFRLLLPQDKINQLYSIARREHPVTEKGLQALRDLHPQYTAMDRVTLEQHYLEEYMADMFDKWMGNKKVETSHVMKSFFAKIIDWIKGLWDRLTGSELQGLFTDINKGRYANAGLATNQFTGVENQGINTPVLKVIKIGTQKVNGKTIDRYLPQEISEQIVSGIVNLFYKEVGDSPEYNKAQVLDKILQVYRDTYDTKRAIYKGVASGIKDLGARGRYMNDLIDLKNAFRDRDTLKSLKEAVDFHLNLMGYKQELDDEEYAANEDEYGPNNTENAHKKTSPLSDYGSLSKFLRGYIGSTTYQLDKDMFGNKKLIDGTPVYANVSANKVYNGLLKILSNHSDESKLLDRMLEYRKHAGNPETVRFINRLLDEVGFNEQTKEPTKDSQLLMQVIKGFNQYDTPYLFTKVGANNTYTVSYANTKDAARNQYSAWRDANLKVKKVSTAALTKLIDTINPTGGALKIIQDETKLEELASTLSENLYKQTGIYLHQMYMKYLIIAGKDPSARTDDQQTFLDLYSNVPIVDSKELSANVLVPLQNGTAFQALDQTQNKLTAGSPYTTLTNLAKGNALFDESVNTMSFKNAENEDIYAHGYPNYDFMSISDLNDPIQVERLRNDPDRQSFLLNDPNFQVLMDRRQVRVEQIDGIKQGNDKDKKGITFRKFNTREYLANLLGLYDIRKQPDTKVTIGDKIFYKVPVSIRTIEAKSSIHLVRTPVITSVKGGKLTKEALDIMHGWVLGEYQRIQRVQQEIAGIQDGTYDGPVYEGYHTEIKKGNKTIPARGLYLFTTAHMMGEEAAALEAEALKGTDIDTPEFRKEIDKQIQAYWNGQVVDLTEYMIKEGLIARDATGKIVNLLAPDYLFKGFGVLDSKMNTGKNMFEHNLAQVLLNDAINTVGINQILFGDEAKSFTDAIDQVKRMAGANAQGPNMVVPFTNKDLGIDHTLTHIHHVTYRTDKVLSSISGKGIDSDDGQMYCTEKGLRYMLFGFGKLNKVQAEILDKIQAGGRVTASEFFDNGGLKDRGAFNSYKLVYFDGQTYLKCSAIPLFKDLPDTAEEAHILRMKMEAYEDKNNTVVFAHPVSVSKAMKQNIVSSVDAIDINNDKHFNKLPAKYMRQQLENPSNKLTITDPSQAKQQIMSEQVDSTPVNFMGTMTTVGAVKAAYLNDISQRITNNYSIAVNSIFNLDNALIELGKSAEAGHATPMLGKFMDYMKENLQATGADQQTIGFMETQNGQPVYNLNFPSTLEKFTQIFLNHFSKGVVGEKVPGLTLALVSGALGMGKRYKEVISLDPTTGQPRQWRVVTDAEYRKNPSKYQDAHRYSDDKARTFEGLQVGDYYLDDLRHNVPEYDEQGNIIGRFSEYIRPAHYREEVASVSDALQRSLGIRIPSDDKHSYISLKMVDTLPVQYGSVGIFPHELIEISGADFDIDKMYVQIADTYRKNGNLVAYGTADTAKGQFEEYVKWQHANNRVFKDLYSADKLYSADEALATLLDDSDVNMYRAEQVLKEMKLPSTVAEYIQAGGPERLNNGVLNNRILAQKIALQSNEHITKDIAHTPTSTDPLTALATELQEQGLIPVEDIGNVNTILGKTIGYTANMEGARNIGATANAIQVYSLLNDASIEIDPRFQITIDGQVYTGFDRTADSDGTRIFSTLSTLLNAMTDNAKERLASRLGLNITALGYVSNMVSMGVPLRTSVLLMLQPSVKNYFHQYQQLSGGLKTEAEQKQSRSKLLSELLMMSNGDPSAVTVEQLVKDIENNKYNDDSLALIQQIDTISKALANISKVQKLSQGIPTSWEDIQKVNEKLDDLGIVYDNGNYKAKEYNVDHNEDAIPVDVRDTLLHGNKIIAKNLQVLAQVQLLGKKVFLEQTPLFSRMTGIATGNMKNMYGTSADIFNKQLKFDTISYLTIRAYKHGLGKDINSLNQATIYPSAKENMSPGYQDIVDIMLNLREMLVDKNENYLVSKFLQVIDAPDSKTGINLVEANTWARINELQQDRLVTSFTLLYTNSYKDANGHTIDTHNMAIALFNYLLVKDGGQFKNGSFIKYIPNYMFKDIMDKTGEVNDYLAITYTGTTQEEKDEYNKKRNEDTQKLFGVGAQELLNDFMQAYSTHIGNEDYIKTVKVAAIGPVMRDTQGNVIIDIFRGLNNRMSKADKAEHIETNKELITSAGFTIDKDHGLELPYSIRVGGALYTLSQIGRDKGTVLTNFLGRDENVPHGTAATYTATPWVGSSATFKSSAAIGVVPETPTSKIVETKSAPTADDIQAQQYQDQDDNYYPDEDPTGQDFQQDAQNEQAQVNTPQTAQEQLAAQGITVSKDSNGGYAIKDGIRYNIPAGTKVPGILAIISGQSNVSLQQMTSEQWKSELSTLYGTDRKSIQAAIDYRNDKRTDNVPDSDILKKIKECPQAFKI